MKLPIVEMFVSIQGEGVRAGVPSLFIRFGGCSLSCPGFGYEVENEGKMYIGCDSIHAVHKDFKNKWTFYGNANDILEKIALFPYAFEDVVITGGEPMIHHQNPIFINLISKLIQEKRVCMETNGTIPVDFDKYPLYKALYLTISPKMSVSGEPEIKRLHIKVLKDYILYAKDVVLKMVMGKKEIDNPSEMQALLHKLNTKIPIYLMPLGATKEQLDNIAPMLWDFSLSNGYRFSDRLHVRLFSDNASR